MTISPLLKLSTSSLYKLDDNVPSRIINCHHLLLPLLVPHQLYTNSNNLDWRIV
jgi:hypothetical protein